jgi:small subunit ribosomal protein S6
MPRYELVVILDPYLNENDYAPLVERVGDIIAKRGLTLTNTETWGKRRLAYPINKKNDGYYVVYTFEGDGGADAVLVEADRLLRLNEAIMRHLVTRLPDIRKPRYSKKVRRGPGAPADAAAATDAAAPEVATEVLSAGSAGDAGDVVGEVTTYGE